MQNAQLNGQQQSTLSHLYVSMASNNIPWRAVHNVGGEYTCSWGGGALESVCVGGSDILCVRD